MAASDKKHMTDCFALNPLPHKDLNILPIESVDYWLLIKDEDGNLTHVIDDGQQDRATIIEGDGTVRVEELQAGSKSGALALASGTGMSRDEMMNFMFQEQGLGWDSAAGIWKPVTEQAIALSEQAIERMRVMAPMQAFFDKAMSIIPEYVEGMEYLSRDQYTAEQITLAEKFRETANANAQLENVQPGYPNGTTFADGSPLTWCNEKLLHDNKAMLGAGNYEKMVEGGRRANHIGMNLAQNYPELGSGLEAQHFANMGLQVRAAWIHPDAYILGADDANSGHVASVVSNYGLYDPRRGPRISQAGQRNGEMWAVQGFPNSAKHPQRFENTRYYWVMPDNLLEGYITTTRLIEPYMPNGINWSER